MGQITTRLRENNQDGYNIANPPTNAFSSETTTIRFGAMPPETVLAFVQFKPNLAPAAVVSKAILRIVPSASYFSPLGTIQVDAIDFFDTTLTPAVVTAAGSPIAHGSYSGAEWAAGVPVEFDVTAQVVASIAHTNYTTGKYVTLSIGTNELGDRYFHAFDGDREQCAELTIDFTWANPEGRTPYEKIVRGLWDMLESDPRFGVLVPPGNRVKFLGPNPGLPVKETVSTADLPEVRIVCTRSQPTDRASSSSTFSRERYEVQVSSGDWRFNAAHFAVKWAVFRAMERWMEVLMSLRWNGARFVNVCRLVDVTEGINIAEQESRGITGWVAVWAIEVDCHFQTSALVPS